MRQLPSNNRSRQQDQPDRIPRRTSPMSRSAQERSQEHASDAPRPTVKAWGAWDDAAMAYVLVREPGRVAFTVELGLNQALPKSQAGRGGRNADPRSRGGDSEAWATWLEP